MIDDEDTGNGYVPLDEKIAEVIAIPGKDRAIDGSQWLVEQVTKGNIAGTIVVVMAPDGTFSMKMFGTCYTNTIALVGAGMSMFAANRINFHDG